MASKTTQKPKSKKREEVKYKETGVGKIVAHVICFVYLAGWPAFWRSYYAPLKETTEQWGWSDEYFWAIVGIANTLLAQTLMGSFFTSLYLLELPFFERYKAEEDPWPWKEDRQKWWRLFLDTALLVGFNVLVLVPIIAFAQLMLGILVDLDFGKETVPTTGKFLSQMIFCAFCDDLFFYFSHRLLHTKWLYQNIHKVHHKHIDTLWYAASAAHPIEYIFGNVLPATSGVLILGRSIHVTTAVGWLFSKSVESLDGHSGYQLSWSPFKVMPFTPGFGYHNFHHSRNIGNYCGQFHLWDTLMGTNKAYHEHRQELSKAVKQD